MNRKIIISAPVTNPALTDSTSFDSESSIQRQMADRDRAHALLNGSPTYSSYPRPLYPATDRPRLPVVLKPDAHGRKGERSRKGRWTLPTFAHLSPSSTDSESSPPNRMDNFSPEWHLGPFLTRDATHQDVSNLLIALKCNGTEFISIQGTPALANALAHICSKGPQRGIGECELENEILRCLLYIFRHPISTRLLLKDNRVATHIASSLNSPRIETRKLVLELLAVVIDLADEAVIVTSALEQLSIANSDAGANSSAYPYWFKTTHVPITDRSLLGGRLDLFADYAKHNILLITCILGHVYDLRARLRLRAQMDDAGLSRIVNICHALECDALNRRLDDLQTMIDHDDRESSPRTALGEISSDSSQGGDEDEDEIPITTTYDGSPRQAGEKFTDPVRILQQRVTDLEKELSAYREINARLTSELQAYKTRYAMVDYDGNRTDMDILHAPDVGNPGPIEGILTVEQPPRPDFTDTGAASDLLKASERCESTLRRVPSHRRRRYKTVWVDDECAGEMSDDALSKEGATLAFTVMGQEDERFATGTIQCLGTIDPTTAFSSHVPISLPVQAYPDSLLRPPETKPDQDANGEHDSWRLSGLSAISNDTFPTSVISVVERMSTPFSALR